MNKDFFTYLKSHAVIPNTVNKLIVTNFIKSNSIGKLENNLIKSLIIDQESNLFSLVEEFSKIHAIQTIEDLIEAFEFVISPEEKIVTGAVYTPEPIRDYIIDQVLDKQNNFTEITVCDPACGCAGFLYSAAKYLKEKTGKSYFDIFRENLFGLDIQNYSIERAAILLSLFAIIEGEDNEVFEFNLFNGNALNFEWKNRVSNFKGFDAVVGNPPYVCSRNIDNESKELLKNWSVCSTGHPDLYIPFFELGLSLVKERGVLGYITMNTFFKSINGRALREFLANGKFSNKIIDFGGHQIFDSKSTYTCICLFQKKTSKSLDFIRINSVQKLRSDLVFAEIGFDSLDHFNGWNLEKFELLKKIESIGTPLGEKFKTRNGIATLKNNIYIFSQVDEDENYYYLQNGNRYPIEKGICADIINPNKFTRIKSVNKILQKVIFPYQFEGENIQLISENDFSNNFPLAYKYLQDKRDILAKRDKGNGKYENWYAYGRNQSLERMKYKLFFPHISSSSPNFVLNYEEDLLFYNGLALVGENKKELLLMQKLMGSRLFWYYITKSSKPYGSGYYSLSRNYIKKFGIPDFTEKEIDFLLEEQDESKINNFLEEKYGISI